MYMRLDKSVRSTAGPSPRSLTPAPLNAALKTKHTPLTSVPLHYAVPLPTTLFGPTSSSSTGVVLPLFSSSLAPLLLLRSLPQLKLRLFCLSFSTLIP